MTSGSHFQAPDNSMSKVAVITRTQNRPLMLPRARQSVVSQTFRDFTWVVVNDAGDNVYVDENAEQARQAGVDVVVIHRPESRGMEAASNHGIRSVSSEYVVIHDDDDSWQPAFLETMVGYLEKNPSHLGAVCYEFGVFEKVSESGIAVLKRVPFNVSLESIQIADMLQHNLFAPISFVFRRSVYDALGGFDENLPPLADWDFNLRVLLRGDIGLVPNLLANYHIRDSVAPAFGAYGNSITSGYSLHMIRDAQYRNLKLREDLDNGVVGLGYLLCQSRQTYRLARNVDYMAKFMRLPQKAWGRLRRLFR